MTTLITRVITQLYGQRVGEDSLGNVYYQHRKTPSAGRRRRWVIYKGDDEASKVPAEWNAWLHYTVDEPPLAARTRRTWEKEHLPNRTGTPEAYRPPGHTLARGRRDKATGDYEAWQPTGAAPQAKN